MLGSGLHDPYGVLSSLLFHENHLSKQEGLFRLMGFVHLYRSSGLHLFALFLWCERILALLLKGREIPPAIARGLAGAGCLWVAFSVWKLQGFHFSWFRPILTFLLRRFFEVRGARVRILFPLGFTALCEWILARDRGGSPGALHYYLAVSGSLIAMEVHRQSGALGLHARMAVYSWIPGALVDLFQDRVISFMTPFYSWISIPPISLMLYPASIFSILWTGELHPFLGMAWDFWLSVLVALADRLPTFAMIRPEAWVFALTLLILLELIPLRNRGWSVPAMAVFIRLCLHGVPQGNRVIQWNVGQGDAALLQGSGRHELIDAGPSFGSDPGRWIRRWTHAGVDRIDGILFSHLDADHRGGLSWMIPVIRITCIESRDPRRERILAHLPSSITLRDSGCVRLPRVAWFRSSRSGGNQWMAGVLFPLSENSAYFALGDGDREQERDYGRWLGLIPRKYRRRIWKAGHHGSKGSSDSSFLKELNPTEVWVSVGARNGYGHPTAEALRRLTENGASLYRTDGAGDLSVSVRE
jgi:beta-lactamase superfamily II metal-dependent hydrolase